jgi:hypothetical protein
MISPSDMKKEDIGLYYNQDSLCAIIYPYEKGFIACEKSSSMGFSTYDGALNWLNTVCKGETLEPQDNTYKMIPEEIKKEITSRF